MRAERIIMSARSFPSASEHTRVLKPFRSLLIEHEQVLFAQAQQSAACNASHTVEASMCRWLFHMRDFAGSDDLTLTQEFLAQMLGVRRPSVSLVANTLQKAGPIKYARGNIHLLDINGLQESPCECYGAVITNGCSRTRTYFGTNRSLAT